MSKNKIINIASTTDSDFTDVLMTFYVSILENNLDSDFRFFVIDDKLTESDKSYIRQLQDIYSNIKNIDFIKSNFKAYKRANTDSPDSAVKENTYYRLELPVMVPVSRILYLDCDMICNGNISDLWNIDLHGNVIGAVQDQGYAVTKKRLQAMGTPQQKKYFNGGLLLFDTKKWNEEHITEKVRKFIQKNLNNLTYQDQDALNFVLNENWQSLDPKFNVQSRLMRREEPHPDPRLEKLAVKAWESPIIIHYSGWSKPWVRTGKWVHAWRDQYYWYKYMLVRRLHDYEPLENYVNNEKSEINK